MTGMSEMAGRPGPTVRTDVVDVYVFCREGGRVRYLQILRAREPMLGTWHPVMGHVEAGETAIATARREAREELGLDVDSALGFWALEETFPFYLPARDALMMSPRFVVEVRSGWEPALNAEHSDARWVAGEESDWLWPGQAACVRAIVRDILPGGARCEALRVRAG